MTEDNQDRHRESIFNERIRILRDKGYRGFRITRHERKWDGVLITARNEHGQVVTAFGDTNEEAFKKIIDQVDQLLENNF
jgi:hypothetical protein